MVWYGMVWYAPPPAIVFYNVSRDISRLCNFSRGRCLGEDSATVGIILRVKLTAPRFKPNRRSYCNYDTTLICCGQYVAFCIADLSQLPWLGCSLLEVLTVIVYPTALA